MGKNKHAKAYEYKLPIIIFAPFINVVRGIYIDENERIQTNKANQ